MTDAFRTRLHIAAPPEVVFEHFTKPELLIRWMGDYAKLDATDGGLFAVDINGVIIRGAFVRVEFPNLIEIAWGEAGNADMPPGSTRLLVRFTPRDGGTELEVEHSGLSPREAGKHAVGWPHFFERLRGLATGADPGSDPWAMPTFA